MDRETLLAPLAGIGDPHDPGSELHQGRGILGDLGNAVDLRTVDIARGIVPQHVAHGADVQLPVEELRPRLAHTGYELDIALQDVHCSTIVSYCDPQPAADGKAAGFYSRKTSEPSE